MTMEFADNYCLKTWAAPKKCDAVLKHIAEKIGWTFEPEDYNHYSCVQRLPSLVDFDAPVHDFRLWYWTTNNGFFFNCGPHDAGFYSEPIRCNDYTIGRIIKTMSDFDMQARKLELQERIDSIHAAGEAYTV